MTTRSAGRATAAPRGGRTGGRTGRGGNEVNYGVDRVLDFSTIIAQQLQNLLPTILAQGDVRNVIVNNNRKGYTYKEFLACSPKEYDGKGGAIVYTRWIEKMVPVQDMSGCEETKRAGHATYTNRFRELARNGSLKRNLEKKGNGREPNRDRNARDKNKRTRTRNAFATTTNPMRREYNGTIPKCVSCNLHHPPEMPFWDCFSCGRPGHIANDCRVAPRMVNPVNARNPTAAPGACYECRGTNHFKVACPRLNQAQRGGLLGLEHRDMTYGINLILCHFKKDVQYQSSGSLEGFAAALAVLITGASQSRQHGKSETALDSIVHFDFSNRRLEQTATLLIPTNSE
nr:hypothetical protein [Tanacetum cinerariifolium]